ncbi:MAG: restriction endonuclease subunit S [Gammaproteobacteria bacterium]|nr:restriction endonuclease subunit S [Gammaproteobacteria bacterium]
MIAKKPSQLIPQLRFPEFRKAGEWKIKPISKLAHITKGVQLNRATITGGEFPVWNGGVTPSGFHNEWNTEGKVITISEGGNSCGFVNRSSQRFWLGGHCYALKNLSSEVEGDFLFQSLKSNETKIMRLRVGSGLPNIQRHDIERFPVVFPHSVEQQLIADCLGSLDDLITAEGRKLEALRQHKQGLMQQLFPQSGKTVPRLRFAEFRDLPEWDLRTLSSASDVNPRNEELPERFIYIDLESVKNSVLTERKEISRDAAPSRAQRLLSHKDIIYQTVRPYQRNNLFFDANDGCKYVASTGYAQLRANESPEFLYQLLHTDSFVSSVLARCTGSNYPAINPSALASIEVSLPRKVEQKRIANFLDSMDDLITAKTRMLELLRKHKKGLIQKLFPSLEEL